MARLCLAQEKCNMSSAAERRMQLAEQQRLATGHYDNMTPAEVISPDEYRVIPNAGNTAMQGAGVELSWLQ